MQASDVLLVNQRASVADMSLPSKLTSYFPAARPVVAAVLPDSETAREIQAAQAGYVVSPEEPAAPSRRAPVAPAQPLRRLGVRPERAPLRRDVSLRRGKPSAR